jgi:signal transduction histidine kinase
MSLSDFVEANLTELVGDWVEYAGTISLEGGGHLDAEQLRNSAREILMRVAVDMREPQSAAQQRAKSRGEQHDPSSDFDRIAHQHADDRLAQGYGINDIVAEYRALRASVLRRWLQTPQTDAAGFQQMIRFNEAIDQMLAESVRQHAQRTERIRDMFAGVLAHDLRSPLGAVLNAAEVLLQDDGLSPPCVKAVAIAQRSAVRMKRMIDDLLVFTRTRLGDTLPVDFSPQDLGRICNDAAAEVRAAHPDTHIDVRVHGDLGGRWDGIRIGQLLVNLLVNAVQHGSGDVCIEVRGQHDQMTLIVSNAGNPIPAHALPTLFDPLTRSRSTRTRGEASAGLGLGLYICRTIADAHGGTIQVESSANRTIFTVRMPRFPSASA